MPEKKITRIIEKYESGIRKNSYRENFTKLKKGITLRFYINYQKDK